MDTIELRLRVNDAECTVTVQPERTLLGVLRDELGLVGAHEGCGVGACGTCTVLVDGQPVSSCLLLAALAQGKAITTIEGLGTGGALHPVQEAFIREAGFQCAFCTSGFILATIALLAEHPNPDDETIREYLSGNFCRCGSYANILRAVKSAAQAIKEGT